VSPSRSTLPIAPRREAEGQVIAASLITRFQRRGLGEQLLRRSIAALWSQGEQELLLFVTDGNTPAQRLYERLGFAGVEPPG
jgi:ribosomal protein S18 acetylase RimI-like enzyme